MRKMTLFAMAALSVLLAGGVQAQKPGVMKPGVMGHKMPMKGQTVSYTGMVKGAATGGSFTLAMKSKSVMVMMPKGVRARAKGGKFASLSPGSNVTAVGTLSGTMLNATSVTVNSSPGGKMMPKTMPGKMNKMSK